MSGAVRTGALLLVFATALMLPTSAGAALRVAIGGREISISGTPGHDVVTVDWNASAREFVIGPKVDPRIPDGCHLQGQELHCPPPRILTAIGVRTVGGDDQVRLGTDLMNYPGDRHFANNVIFAQVATGPGDDDVESAADFSQIRLLQGDDRASIKGPVEEATIHGGPGDDAIAGGRGGDFLSGGPGADTLDGVGGDDELSGGSGFDRLEGGSGNDFLEGGPGRDILDGGRGPRDRCEPGPGARPRSAGCELTS